MQIFLTRNKYSWSKIIVLRRQYYDHRWLSLQKVDPHFIFSPLSFFMSLLDKNRIPKSLHTNHPLGSTPLVREFDSEKQEAAFIAFEIKRCVANMGGVLRWGDFVILRK